MKNFLILMTALALLLTTPAAYADSSSSQKSITMVEPFFRAVKSGQVDRVSSCLTTLPPLAQAKDSNSVTALHIAAVYGYKDIAELLITKGALVNAKDKQGKSPLYYALKRNHTALADLLRSHGAQE